MNCRQQRRATVPLGTSEELQRRAKSAALQSWRLFEGASIVEDESRCWWWQRAAVMILSPTSSSSSSTPHKTTTPVESRSATTTTPVECRSTATPTTPAKRTDAPPPSDHARTSRSVLPLAALLVVSGCAAQLPHELMNNRDKGSGDLISLFEYAFGMALSVRWLTSKQPLRIPARRHAVLASLGLMYVFFSNVSLASNVPTSVYAALKNGTLFANLVVGTLLLRKQYSAPQCCAVAVVTAGLVATALRARQLREEGESRGSDSYGLGVASLLLALLARASSGAVQESFMRLADGDVATSEMVFMRAALGLPFFVARSRGVTAHLLRWVTDPGLASQWLLLGTNLVFDYCCKVVMTTLIKRSGALTASLVLSVQKFVAFTVSVVFVNPALRSSLTIWAGALAVLLGTLAYSAASSCCFSHRASSNGALVIKMATTPTKKKLA